MINSVANIRSTVFLQIDATASRRGTHTRMRIISDDGHQASVRAVCVVQLVSTADSRTERLCVLLTASNSHHCIALAIIDAGRRNNRHPQIVSQRKKQ